MNVFDVIGPIMIGPSSSHTAGAVKLGNIALSTLGERCVKADILLSGSFASTYKGHGTDKALLSGIMGLSSDDERIRSAWALARERGLCCQFHPGSIPGAHPNTARLTLEGETGKTCEVEGASIGGGSILIHRVDGLAVNFTGQAHTLLIRHQDEPGAIAAVTNLMADHGINIGNFSLTRSKKGGEAVMMVEVDSEPDQDLNERIRRLPGIMELIFIKR